jgi:hypothetical protein
MNLLSQKTLKVNLDYEFFKFKNRNFKLMNIFFKIIDFIENFNLYYLVFNWLNIFTISNITKLNNALINFKYYFFIII